MTTCQHCQTEFAPKRTTARYCGDTCRQAAHRSPPRARQAPRGAVISVTGAPHTAAADLGRSCHAKLPAGIVPDAKWPGMYRLVRQDGTLSDMVNLTRAKDAVKQGEA